MLAIGILHAASSHGVTVPDDLSVVGFDDIPFSSMTVPASTTVRMPVGQMMRAAVAMTVDGQLRDAAGTRTGSSVFRSSLVVRRSSGRAAGT